MHANKYYLITFAYVKLCKRNKWNFYARVKAPVKPAGECQLFTHCYVGLMNERENRFLHDWEHITIYTHGLTQTIKTNTSFIWILNMAENSENPNNGSDELSGISWKPEARTLSDIGDDSLPCVCKLSSDGSRALPVGLSIYCQQPLYLYKRRQRKQVLGRTIYHDANGPYYEVGQTLILPDNFEG